MSDYYSILSKAVTAPSAGGTQWRRVIYDRARQTLLRELRARRPQPAPGEIRAQQSKLEAAIGQIESELSQAGAGAQLTGTPVAEPRVDARPRGVTGAPQVEPRPQTMAKPLALKPVLLWAALAVIVAAVAAGAYAFWPRTAHQTAAAIRTDAPGAAKQAARAPELPTEKDGDLAPGVDGGSNDAELPYVFRRQPTFYRTTNPPGTIIIDKLQHFLYLTQPNNVALRYGIGLGGQCEDLAGLRRVTSKSEWPAWLPPPDMVGRKLAKPGPLAGGPGNPLGARLLALDDGSGINGTNAPRTIGTSVVFGCFRMVNDDIVDLYGRVPAGTPVIVQ
jgi:lipoprotein-anchoring transpeptidase ErfK/SrfK